MNRKLYSHLPVFIKSPLELSQKIKGYHRNQKYLYFCQFCNELTIGEKRYTCTKQLLCKSCSMFLIRCSDESKSKFKNTVINKYGSLSSFYKSVYQKTVKSNLEKYGVENTFQRQDVKDKIRNDALRMHGVGAPGATKEALDKQRKTMLEKYGVENAFMDGPLREKGRETTLEKFGNYNNTEKTKITLMDRYNVDATFKIPSVKEKIMNTMLERYGTTHPYFGHNFYDYNGTIFDSSWELIYFMYLKLNNVPFKYHPFRIPYNKGGKIHYYEPDFIVNDCLVEIKGPQFLNEKRQIINPFTKELEIEKTECMLANNVLIISDISKYKYFVESKLGKGFVKAHVFKGLHTYK